MHYRYCRFRLRVFKYETGAQPDIGPDSRSAVEINPIFVRALVSVHPEMDKYLILIKKMPKKSHFKVA